MNKIDQVKAEIEWQKQYLQTNSEGMGIVVRSELIKQLDNLAHFIDNLGDEPGEESVEAKVIEACNGVSSDRKVTLRCFGCVADVRDGEDYCPVVGDRVRVVKI